MPFLCGFPRLRNFCDKTEAWDDALWDIVQEQLPDADDEDA